MVSAPHVASSWRAGHRPDIEGMRAVAVLLVVAFHAGFGVLPGGYVGVDVFFVLSGYLITGLLADELVQTGRISFVGFYGRRARRLMPLATVVLLATAAAFAAVVAPFDRGDVVADIRAAALYFANWHFAADSLDYMSDVDKSPVLHYWSLSVEEQFYVVWPMLLVLVAGRGRGRRRGLNQLRRMVLALTVVGTASFVASAVLTPTSPAYAYFGLHTRAWELAAGGLLALGAGRLRTVPPQARRMAGWIGLTGIVQSAAVIGPGTAFPGTAALLPVCSTVLVVAAGGPGVTDGVSRLLAAPALTYVGRLSYAWYLWHWPCLVFAGMLAGGTGSALGDGSDASWHGRPALIAVVSSFALSVVSHHLYESPIRRNGWLTAVRHRSLALGAGMTTACIWLVAAVMPVDVASAHDRDTLVVTAPRPGHTASPAPRNVHLTMTPAQAKEDNPPGNRGCRVGQETVHVRDDCQYGDPNGTFRIALLGDSHAHQWLPALQTIAVRHHWQLWMFEKASCPMIGLTPRLPVFNRAYPSCGPYRESVLERLSAMGRWDAVLVAHASRYADYLGTAENDPLEPAEAVAAWGSAWAQMSNRLHEVTDHVVVIRDGPVSPSDVPSCLAEHPDDARPCSFPRDVGMAAGTALFEAERSSAADTTEFLDVTGLICPSPTCPVVWYDGTIMYRDEHHLTATFAQRLAPFLAQQLLPLLHDPPS